FSSVNHFENDEMDPYWDPQGEIPWRYYGVQPVPVQYQQFQYNPAVQQSWAEGIQLQHGQATFMLPYWTTTAEQQQYAAQQQFAVMYAQQYDATQHQQVATQQQQAAAKQQNVATKHQEGAKQHQDEEKQQKEKSGTTKTIQERLDTASKTIHGLKDEVAYYKSSYQKATEDLGVANQEQRSLAQRCELWKKNSQRKNLVIERLEKDKAVLSKKIQVDNCHLFTFFHCLTFTLFRNNDNLRDDLAAFKKQVELLKEQLFSRFQNYNLRYYGGVIGKFRRMKRFIVNAFQRFSS
ncbi:unnamed protein product, partial [Porites lobata]